MAGDGPPTGAEDDPLTRIRWVPAGELRANHWNPNRVQRSEADLLARSIASTGWVQPILANTTGLIIDGFHRWRLAQDDPGLVQRYGAIVPVAHLDVTDAEAMAITVRINRAKGAHAAVEMSALVHALAHEHGWTRERIAAEIGATADEVDLLLMDGVFKHRHVDQWAWSEEWYPKAMAGITKNEPTRGGYGDTGTAMNVVDAARAGIIDQP